MNFYYHPILGLQYTNLGSNITLDIDQISNKNIHEIYKMISKVGILPFSKVYPIDFDYKITEYYLG